VTIEKHGDDTPYMPVTGARFEIAGRTVAAGEPVDLEAGRYAVDEVEAPPGYAVAGPWAVDLTNADATLVVDDQVVRGSLTVAKRDAVTHDLVAGAVVTVDVDRDHDGTFETAVTELTTASTPAVLDHLVPADYRVTERTPPPGYVGDGGSVVVRVPPGAGVEVTLDDQATPTTTTSALAVTTVPTTTTSMASTTTSTTAGTTTTSTTPAATAAPAPTVETTVVSPSTTSTSDTATPAAPAGTMAAPEAAPPETPSLPRTGADTVPLAAAGLALIGAGATARRAGGAGFGRRRRPRSPP
jgi:LPXTG-motif cell wall-anchored protein